jgi:hypothetical protein
MTISENLKGKLSMWRRDKGPFASGKFSVTPDVLKAFLELPVDDYGCINLDIVLFEQSPSNPKAPTLTGHINKSSFVPKSGNSTPTQQQRQPMSTATTRSHSSDDRPIDDFNDEPF